MKWTYKERIFSKENIPEDAIGFIYMITDFINGRYYIGKKSFTSITRKKIGVREKLATKTRKRFNVVHKDTNWEDYNGSCKPLLEDIKKNPQNFSKEILKFGFSRKNLTYLEMEAQVHFEVLTDELSYNENILGKYFKQDVINTKCTK